MKIIGRIQLQILFTIGLSLALILPLKGWSQTWTGKSQDINPNIGGFFEYLPAGYSDASNSTKKYPVIVFIHGLGELGNGSSELGKLENTGLPQLIKWGGFPSSFTVGGNQFSFIVICPQFKGWPNAPDVDAMITYAAQTYRVDPSRIYLTGLSMGGGAVWDYAGASATNANKLAAIVPICGASWPLIDRAKVMAEAKLPVWATHNADDGVVGVDNTNFYVDGINSFSPAIPAKKTIWPTGGHDAWTRTYNPATKLDGVLNCYEWMLQYTRSGAPTPTPSPLPPIATWISARTDVSCNGSTNGSATVAISGGTGPYTYTWNTSPVQTGTTASNLAPGNYTVTVKDALGATGSVGLTIYEPAVLRVNATAGTIAAAGGTTSVTLSPTGGTAPYTYTGPTSNLTAGTYSYIVTDARGCTASQSVTITDPGSTPPPPPTSLSASISAARNPGCFGAGTGTATVSASGGQAPYSYSWNTNPVQTGSTASNLPAGSYTVTVRDAANSTATATVTISQPLQLGLSANAGTISVFGGTTAVTLNATGGTAPYTYQGGTTNLTAGSYNYSVTDAAGCTASTSLTITQPNQITVNAVAGTIKCNGGTTTVSLNASGGQAPYTFQGETSNLRAGTYQFSATDANGAKGTVSITIPEPATLVLQANAGNITLIGGVTSVSLQATGGTAPYSYTGTTAGLKAGSYQYAVTDAQGCQASRALEIKEPGIKLSSFNINLIDTSVRLNWSTQYEYAIDRFEIEKAKDAKTFRGIGSVRSSFSANSAVPLAYKSDDLSSLSGSNTYRLYAVTIYGEKILLMERNLFLNEKGSASIRNMTNSVEVKVISDKAEKVNIMIYDAAGRPLKNLLEQKSNAMLRVVIPMDDLPKGYYVVRVFTPSMLQLSKQVIKP